MVTSLVHKTESCIKILFSWNPRLPGLVYYLVWYAIVEYSLRNILPSSALAESVYTIVAFNNDKSQCVYSLRSRKLTRSDIFNNTLTYSKGQGINASNTIVAIILMTDFISAQLHKWSERLWLPLRLDQVIAWPLIVTNRWPILICEFHSDTTSIGLRINV